jgi:hypothetical protein
MTPAEVIALFATPERLMRQCYLHIAGGATKTLASPHLPPPPANGQAVIATFKVAIVDHKTVRGFTTGVSGFFGRRKDRPFVRVTKVSGPAKATPAADELNAYYIPMVQTSDVGANASHYSLPTAGVPDIALTSKLSGCRFGVGSDAGGTLLVSHVQPDSAIPRGFEQLDAYNHVVSGFNSVTGTFGLEQDYDMYAAVIGKRTGTAWKFYCQASTLANDTYSIDATTSIG